MQGNGKGTLEATAACIDAETLAAWADGGLSTAEAAAVEVHLADCERCTAMLATFTRTIPETPAPQSLWKQWHLRWLVPVATAATVAALWVLVPRPESPQITTLRSEPTADAPAESAPQASQAPSPAASAQSAPAVETKKEEAKTARTQPAPADAPAKREESPGAPQRSADARQNDPGATQPQRRALDDTTTLAAPPSAREADRADAKPAEPQAERFSPPAPAPPANAANAAPAAAAPSPAIRAESQARARGVASPAGAAAPIIEILSPDPMTRWRVVGVGQVERSTNGAARWERATLPESATLTGGSSPSPSVCWLVGRTGSIYVTTDGLRFVRVPFPDRTDFVSIQALDARRATVVTIDGRTMRTEDQGVTWIRIAP